MEQKASNLLEQVTNMQWYLNQYYEGVPASLDPNKQQRAIEERMKAYLEAEKAAREAREALQRRSGNSVPL